MHKTHIYMIDDIITEDDCNLLIEYIKKNGVKEASLIPDTNVSANVVQVDDQMNHIVKPVILKIMNVLKKLGFDIYDCVIPMLRQIYDSTHFHVDNLYDNSGDDNVKLNRLRCMSVIIALNSDYEGGEFCFPEQDYTVKLTRGQVLLFPPYWTHPHYTRKLYNNTHRYTITTWFYGTMVHPIRVSVHEPKDSKP